MGGPTKKHRANFSIDKKVYQEARLLFDALGMSMSAFVEQQLAAFVHGAAPMKELLTGEDVPTSPAEVGRIALEMLKNMQDVRTETEEGMSALLKEMMSDLKGGST